MVSKDDTVGQYLPIYKQPTGSDHLFLDQEISGLIEEGAESLYKCLSLQSGLVAYVFDDSSADDDPQQQLSRHFVPTNNSLSRYDSPMAKTMRIKLLETPLRYLSLPRLVSLSLL